MEVKIIIRNRGGTPLDVLHAQIPTDEVSQFNAMCANASDKEIAYELKVV